MPSLAEIEAELNEARAESRALRDSSIRPPEALLKMADQHREQLALYVNARRTQWSAFGTAMTQLKARIEAARRMISSRGSGGWVEETQRIVDAGSDARKAAQAVKHDQRQFRVLRKELSLVRQKLSDAGHSRIQKGESRRPESDSAAGHSSKLDVEGIRRSAILADVEKRLDTLTSALATEEIQCRKWLSDPQSWDAYVKILDQTRTHLSRGEVDDAQQSLASAEAAGEALRQKAAANRESSVRNELVAEAIMQALCDRNYNTPNFGELKEGDPLGGIQIRADVPNRDGKGNLRIDIHLDGRTVFEVENVSVGEEMICKDVIKGVGDAIAGSGLILEMKDWGRAAGAADSSVTIQSRPAKQRIAEREEDRSK